MPKAKSTPASTATAAVVPAAIAPAMPAGFAGLPPGAPPPAIISFDPDQAVSVGRANNFNGRVLSILATPWLVEKDVKGKGKIKLYELAAELTILADDHSLGKDGIVTEMMKMDQLSQFVPSRVDPVWNPQTQQWVYTPAGSAGGQPVTLETYLALANGQTGWESAEIDATTGLKKWAQLPPDDWKGYFVIPGPACSRTGLMKGTKFQHFTTELKRLGYHTMAPHINWADFRQFLVGVYGTWVRLPFVFTGGQTPQGMGGAGGREIETLCLTQVLDLGPISGAGSPQPQALVALDPGATKYYTPGPAIQPQPAPAAAATTPSPAPAPVAQPEPQTVATSPLGGKDPAIVSAAANEILTNLVTQWVAGGSNLAAAVNKTLAGTAVYEGLNQRGLDAGLGLRFVNDPEWMEGDERGFAYDASRGMLLPLS